MTTILLLSAGTLLQRWYSDRREEETLDPPSTMQLD